LLWRRRGYDLWELRCRRGGKGWRCVCGVVVECWEGWRECRIRRSPVRLLWRLPLSGWEQASWLVVVGCVVDGLRRLGVGASVEFFFLLLDEGAIARPMPLVPVVNAAVGDFLPSAGVVSVAAVGFASIAPPSFVVLRPGVARFIAGDRVHDLRGLRLLSLVRPRSVVVAHPLRVHLF